MFHRIPRKQVNGKTPAASNPGPTQSYPQDSSPASASSAPIVHSQHSPNSFPVTVQPAGTSLTNSHLPTQPLAPYSYDPAPSTSLPSPRSPSLFPITFPPAGTSLTNPSPRQPSAPASFPPARSSRVNPNALEERMLRIRGNKKVHPPLKVPDAKLPPPASQARGPNPRMAAPNTHQSKPLPMQIQKPRAQTNTMTQKFVPLKMPAMPHIPTENVAPKEQQMYPPTSAVIPPASSLSDSFSSSLSISPQPVLSTSPSHFHRSEFNFPNLFTIKPQELHKYLWSYHDQILVIDIRSRQDFNAGHIPSSNVICFEPIAIRQTSHVTSETLEDALIMSPDHEQALFKTRDTFPLVVYYDSNTSSTDFLSGRYSNESEHKLFLFVDYIFHKAHNKVLKRPPSLLLGGLEKWVEFYEQSSLWKSATLLPASQNGDNDDSTEFEIYNMGPAESFSKRTSFWDKDFKEFTTDNYYNNYSLGGISTPKNEHGFAALNNPPLPSKEPSLPPLLESHFSTDSNPSALLQYNPQPASAHQNYARNATEFFSNGMNSNPQSLQNPFPGSGNGTALWNTSNPQPNRGYNGINSSVPRPLPPKVNIPQNQSQYSTFGANQRDSVNSGSNNWHSSHGGHGMGALNNQVVSLARSFSTGLTNLGNTCYINCIIQCLVATEHLSLSFLSYPNQVNVKSRLGYKGQLYSVFFRLLEEMMRRDNSYVSPVMFRKVCGTISNDFRGNEQQDCQEFLNFLLDGLHEELNADGDKTPLRPLTEAEERGQEELSLRVASMNQWKRHLYNNRSPITEFVQGQYLSRLSCTECHTTSTTYSAFSSLSLPIPLQHRECTLRDCFRLFTAQEVLQGDNAWFCPCCQRRQRTIKHMLISRFPQVLVVHLKRFRSNEWSQKKLEAAVSYPLKGLDLTEFWIPSTTSENDLVSAGATANDHQSPPFLYNLYAVATHSGTLKGGHYTSFVKRAGHGWCYFDDTRVYKNVGSKNAVNQNAYVLFFERVRAG